MFIKNIAKLFFEKLGYYVVKKNNFAPDDLREEIDNPLLAKYVARKNSFLINAEVKKCILFWKFCCSKGGDNPLINTVNRYLQDGKIKYSGSVLEKYYNSYQPKNVAELFNLEGEIHSDLKQLPAYLFVCPWEEKSMQEKKIGLEKAVKRVTKRRGNELSIEHGSGWFGPASIQRGELEIKILVELTESMKKNGYQRSNDPANDIIAMILVNGNDYKYLIKDGSHRISVLSALDYEKVPIRIIPRGMPDFIYHLRGVPAFIYRQDVEVWPNVISGLYNKQQALKIFDTMFYQINTCTANR